MSVCFVCLFFSNRFLWELVFSTPEPSIFSDYFKNTMVYIAPFESWLLIVYPYEAETYICIDSCLYSSEKKLWLGWIPLGYNHSSKSWSSCPWSLDSPSIRVDSFKYLPNESYQQIYLGFFFIIQYSYSQPLLFTHATTIPSFSKVWLINGLAL